MSISQPGAFGKGCRTAQALRTVTALQHLGGRLLTAVDATQAVLATRIGLVQVPLRQAVKAQQQMIERLLQVRFGTGHQGIEVFRLVIEGCQDLQTQRQAVLGDGPARLFDHRGGGAVGMLRIERRQGHPAHALLSQALQRAGN